MSSTVPSPNMSITVPSPKPAPLSVSPSQDKGTSALSGAQIKALGPDSSAPLRGYAQPPAPIPNLATSLHCGTTPSRPPAASPRTLQKLSSSSPLFYHSPLSTAGAPGETSATLPTSAQQPGASEGFMSLYPIWPGTALSPPPPLLPCWAHCCQLVPKHAQLMRGLHALPPGTSVAVPPLRPVLSCHCLSGALPDDPTHRCTPCRLPLLFCSLALSAPGPYLTCWLLSPSLTRCHLHEGRLRAFAHHSFSTQQLLIRFCTF